MKKLLSIAIVGLMLISTSCATIFTGSHRKVLFESNPPGASIYVNGKEKGVTPKKLSVSAKDKVDFRLDNYKEQVVVMDSKFNLVAIINGFNLLSWGIDALTGSLKRVDTKYVRVTLVPSSKTTLLDYLEKGNVASVSVSDETKTIETTIILK